MLQTTLFAAAMASSLGWTAAQRPDCPGGWTPHNQHCYKLFKDTVDRSFDETENECSKNGAHLAEIESAGELDFLGSLVGDFSSLEWKQLPRIGGRRENVQDGSFRPLFGSGLYTYWCSKTYPNNYNALPESKDEPTCLYLLTPKIYGNSESKRACMDDDYCRSNTGHNTITRGHSWICKRSL